MKPGPVPVVDIEDLWSRKTLSSLDRACREWGFFQITNHGLKSSLVTGLSAAMHEFFMQQEGDKQVVARTVDNPWGFYDRELTKNRLDWKQVYDYGPGDGNKKKPQWPPGLPGFENAILSYYRQCEILAFNLMAAISTNLGMRREYLERHFRPDHTSFLRLNYYPVCPVPETPAGLSVGEQGYLGINHHTDAGALTILLQDEQPGLEVYRNGTWHLVEPRSDALVVNIGDIVQVWSNDRYQASLHRVLASIDKPRFSVPFFFNPHYQTDYEPLPCTVDASHPARYRRINWGEFRSRRAAGDFADYGQEVQVSDYRIEGGNDRALY